MLPETKINVTLNIGQSSGGESDGGLGTRLLEGDKEKVREVKTNRQQ